VISNDFKFFVGISKVSYCNKSLHSSKQICFFLSYCVYCRFVSFIEGDSHINDEEISIHEDDPFTLLRPDDDDLILKSL
jgi:hypothetical protein